MAEIWDKIRIGWGGRTSKREGREGAENCGK
jgi:hypothetical protein